MGRILVFTIILLCNFPLNLSHAIENNHSCLQDVLSSFSEKSSLENFKQSQFVLKESKNGKKFLFKKVSYFRTREQGLPSGYQEWIDQTVEVLYTKPLLSDHIALRIGKKTYEMIGKGKGAMIRDNFSWANSYQFVNEHSFGFFFSKTKIQDQLKAVDNFFEAANGSKLVIFDQYSRDIRLVQTGTPAIGELIVSSGKAVRFEFTAIREEVNGQSFLRDPNGVTLPIIKKDDGEYFRSFSCSSASTWVLNKILGIPLPEKIRAYDLQKLLLHPGPTEVMPEFIIRYGSSPLDFE